VISDIFGAPVESFIGLKNNEDIWLIGDDIQTPGVAGDARRCMCDPVKDTNQYPENNGYPPDYKSSRDYYPDRYQGTYDQGGVHINSGIANLGECMNSCYCLQHASSRLLY